jgi:hypothetical protein
MAPAKIYVCRGVFTIQTKTNVYRWFLNDMVSFVRVVTLDGKGEVQVYYTDAGNNKVFSQIQDMTLPDYRRGIKVIQTHLAKSKSDHSVIFQWNKLGEEEDDEDEDEVGLVLKSAVPTDLKTMQQDLRRDHSSNTWSWAMAFLGAFVGIVFGIRPWSTGPSP